MPVRRRPRVDGATERLPALLAGLLLLGLILVAVATSARAAGCVCDDRDGCAVDAACAGDVPGDACTADGRSTCRITVGTTADPTCCCTCGRGAGPRSCVFAPVLERASAAKAALDCGAAARRAMTAAVDDLALRLLRAETACRDGSSKATRLVAVARRRLERLRRKLDRLVERGKTTAECAERLGTAVDAIDADIDDIAQRGMPGGGGQPVTTTTLPGATASCSGTLAIAGTYGLDVAFSCPSGPALFTAFGVLVPSRHQITGFTAPEGFTCAISTWSTPNDFWTCSGPFTPGGVVAGGRVVLDPAPTANMTASLYVQQGPARFGPFALDAPR